MDRYETLLSILHRSDRSDGVRLPAPTNDLLKLAAAGCGGYYCTVWAGVCRPLARSRTLDRQALRTLALLSLLLLLPTPAPASNMLVHRPTSSGVDGAGLVLWVGGPPDASFGFYLREAFQSQTNTEKILYESLGTDML